MLEFLDLKANTDFYEIELELLGRERRLWDKKSMKVKSARIDKYEPHVVLIY